MMAQDPSDVMYFSEHVELLNKAIKKVAAELHDNKLNKQVYNLHEFARAMWCLQSHTLPQGIFA